MPDASTTETCFTVIDSPIGPLTLVSRARPAHQSRHGRADPCRTAARRAAGGTTTRSPTWPPSSTSTSPAGAPAFDVPMDLEGTEFQRAVWAQLCAIPYGRTISYGELARRVGNPKAARAVGTANGHNPVALIVPCHRVIAGDGGIGGYGGGTARKSLLLELERTHLAERRLTVTARPPGRRTGRAAVVLVRWDRPRRDRRGRAGRGGGRGGGRPRLAPGGVHDLVRGVRARLGRTACPTRSSSRPTWSCPSRRSPPRSTGASAAAPPRWPSLRGSSARATTGTGTSRR